MGREITLHRDSTALTLAAARIYIFGIWIVRLLIDDTASISFLDIQLFHPFGVMKLIHISAIELLLTSSGLLALKSLALMFLILGLLGVGRKFPVIAVAAALLVLYLGVLKGFGGHVNHRELILLYMTVTLCFLPCYDALAISPDSAAADRPQRIYTASMIALCLVLLFHYAAIGAARIFVGAPEVFNPEVMQGWIISRNLRPNPYEFELGTLILGYPLLLALALPLSTLLELMAPLVIWSGSWTRSAILLSLALFHGTILLLMNIPFFENVLLLLLCTNYTPLLTRAVCKSSHRSHDR